VNSTHHWLPRLYTLIYFSIVHAMYTIWSLVEHAILHLVVSSGFRLLAASLIDSAIRDVLTGKDEAGDALEWIQGASAPLTLTDCATALGTEPGRLRVAILRLVREQEPKLVARFRKGAVLQVGRSLWR